MSQLGIIKHIVISSWDGGTYLVVGGDISVRKIMDLEGWKLMDKFYGKRVSTDWLKVWIQEEWSLVVGYGPIIHFMGRGLLVLLL